jgi:maleate cis-trans isomerase
MRGTLARIGIIQLDTAMMDHEFWELAPEGVSIFITRLRGHPPEIEGLRDAAKDLVSCKPNCVLYACTSGSFGPGPAWNDLLIETMTEVTGTPATTASQAIVEALHALRAKSISVTAPYNDEYNAKLKHFLEAKGFTVTAMKSAPDVGEFSDDFTKFLCPPATACEVSKDTYVAGSDAHLISCAAWRTLPIIEKLENVIGVPVVTSVQAAIWHCMKLSGLDVNMEGKGKLFEI